MLTFLSIRNLALVDQLLWEPLRGFICITGETGAGKSVIINAISLALGERADKSLIRTGEENCSVEAVFSLPETSVVHGMLEAHGMPPCEDGTLMIRRIISVSANRQFINDSPCTLGLLREVGAYLVDMHGPNDHRSLVSRERQLSLVDSFGGHQEILDTYSEAWKKWHSSVRKYNELEQAEAATERELDLLKHLVDEVESAGFDDEEVASLEERWQRARNSTRLLETAARMQHLLSGEGGQSLLSGFGDLNRAGQDLARLDASAEPWIASLQTVEIELGEFESSLRNYLDGFDADPEALAVLEERINLLEQLKRKYGPGYEEVTEQYRDALERLDRIEHRSERLVELEQIVAESQKEVAVVGAQLTEARKKAAPLLAREIEKHSRELGFAKASFDVQIIPLDNAASNGFEEVEFLFGPNIGEPCKALRLIASSGELSRVMLAVKSAMADRDSTPLLVFDEIDANVGGEVARAVGRKMQELGIRHQIISITHFPQVAAMAGHHYLVEKALLKDRSVSRLREVEGSERVDELVRMLGGGGDEARAHAQTLLS